jgi:hypothetical protein
MSTKKHTRAKARTTAVDTGILESAANLLNVAQDGYDYIDGSGVLEIVRTTKST